MEDKIPQVYQNIILSPSQRQNGLERFKGLNFYCGRFEPSKDSHLRICCFNHLVGLPEKETGEVLPLFDYEAQLYQAWKSHKHLWILKATGLGVTEFFLRLMLWLATRSNEYQGCQFCIIVGPNIDLAKKLIKRMKNILRDVLLLSDSQGQGARTRGEATDTQTAIEINKVWIQAFPSNHLDAYRSLDKPKFIFLDEADFFRKGEQEDVRHVSERYIGKSRPYIVMVSTPDRPDGLMQSIEAEEPSIYHKIKLGYEIGLGKIYNPEDIEKVKQSPSFEREYNLKYLGKIGNVFSQTMINQAIALGEQFKALHINQGASHFGGIDPGFSKTTPVYIGELDREHQCVRIIYCKRYDNAIPSELVKEVWALHKEYLNLHWFVDASNRGFINELKFAFNESQNWNKPEDVSHRSNRIIPVNFGSHQDEYLLEHVHSLLSAGYVAIPKAYDKLITSLQTAHATEWNLDKDETVYDDDLDCLRLLLKEVKIK